MRKLTQSLLGGDEEQPREDNILDEQEGLCSLSPTQLSEAFLIGPGQQIRMMLDAVRIYATAIYVGCVVLALICALLIHSKILTIIAIICEICAFIWYSLSYIPFARRMVSDVTIRLFDTEI